MNYIKVFILIILWTLGPFLKKKSIEDMEISNFIWLHSMFCFVIFSIINVYKQTELQLPNKWIIVSACVSSISATLYVMFIKDSPVALVKSITTPLLIVTTAMVGHFVDKPLRIHQYFGIFLVISGIIVMKMNKFT